MIGMVIVTGGSSGIGLATATRLSDFSDSVWSLARRPCPYSPPVKSIEHDLTTDPSEALSPRKFPKIGALVYCAGVYDGPVYEVNTNGFVRTLDAVADRLVESKGVVILVSSYAAGRPEYKHYGRSKELAESHALYFGRQHVGKGVRVNIVRPHLVGPTGLMRADTVPHTCKSAAGRLGKPREVAELIVELMRNEYINGAVVPVDGGMRFLEEAK